MKKSILIPILFSLVPFLSFGSVVKGGENVTISEPVYENIYVAGGKLKIEAPVHGDLIAAGGEIYVRDTIFEDVMAFGGKLIIEAPILGDLRMAGGEIVIGSTIENDFMVAGGSINVEENAQIMGDFYSAGGQINFKGLANKKFEVRSGELFFDGTVVGKSTLSTGSLELGDQAQFRSNVDYWTADGNYDFGVAISSSSLATYKPSLGADWNPNRLYAVGMGMAFIFFYQLLMAAIIIAFLVWGFNRFFQRLSTDMNEEYLNQISYGVLYLLGIPLLIALSFITIIGIPIGLFFLMLYGISVALGIVVSSVLIAYAVNYYYAKSWNRRQLFLVAFVIHLALKIIGWIPFLGTIALIILVSMAYGTLLHYWIINRRGQVA